VHRLLNHGVMKKEAVELTRPKKPPVLRALSTACPGVLVGVANDFVALQEARHTADYDVGAKFYRPQVDFLVQRADRSISSLVAARTQCPKELDAFLVQLLGPKT
jgi:hypothetical protein